MQENGKRDTSAEVDGIKRIIAGYEEVQRGLIALGISKEVNRWENVVVSKATLDAFTNEENIRANKGGWYRDEEGEVHFTDEYDESVYTPVEVQIMRPDPLNGRWEIDLTVEIDVSYEFGDEVVDALGATGGVMPDGVILRLNPAGRYPLRRSQYILSGIGVNPGDDWMPEEHYEPLVDHLEELLEQGFLVPTDDPDIFETRNPGIEEQQAVALDAFKAARAKCKADKTDYSDPDAWNAHMVLYRAQIDTFKHAQSVGAIRQDTAFELAGIEAVAS